MAFLGGWKYKLSKQRIKSNTHAEGIFYFIFQKEAIFAGADTLSEFPSMLNIMRTFHCLFTKISLFSYFFLCMCFVLDFIVWDPDFLLLLVFVCTALAKSWLRFLLEVGS